MTLARALLTCGAGSALALGVIAADEPSKIYECKDATGSIVYQDDPCLEIPPVSAKPVAAPKHPAAQRPKPKLKPRPAVIPKMPRPVEPAPSGRPVDVRWATPEETLRTFVGAVKDGDRELVLSCLTSDATADLGPDAAAIPLETLRETVESFTGYVAEGDLGPYWSIRALREGTRPKWIFFERTWDGTWRIAAF